MFASGQGLDFVYDFEDGVDLIQLKGIAFEDVTLNAYRDTDVLIGAGEDMMILRNVDIADLTVDDFIPDAALLV